MKTETQQLNRAMYLYGNARNATQRRRWHTRCLNLMRAMGFIPASK